MKKRDKAQKDEARIKELSDKLAAIDNEKKENERKALEEQGKFKELLEQTTAELNDYKTKYSTLESDLNVYKQAEIKEAENLVKSLSKAFPDQKEIIATMNLGQLKAFAKAAEKKTANGAAPPNTQGAKQEVDLSKMSAYDRQLWKLANEK